jgi:ribosomal protein S6E (S10)
LRGGRRAGAKRPSWTGIGPVPVEGSKGSVRGGGASADAAYKKDDGRPGLGGPPPVALRDRWRSGAARSSSIPTWTSSFGRSSRPTWRRAGRHVAPRVARQGVRSGAASGWSATVAEARVRQVVQRALLVRFAALDLSALHQRAEPDFAAGREGPGLARPSTHASLELRVEAVIVVPPIADQLSGRSFTNRASRVSRMSFVSWRSPRAIATAIVRSDHSAAECLVSGAILNDHAPVYVLKIAGGLFRMGVPAAGTADAERHDLLAPPYKGFYVDSRRTGPKRRRNLAPHRAPLPIISRRHETGNFSIQ